MKNFILLILALLLGIFITEAQTQSKLQKSKSGFVKQKTEKVATKQEAGNNPDGYCTASGGCDEYISQVVLGYINNSTLCNEYSYMDFVSADIPLNWYDIITVTNGNPYDLDECGIWVDWNRDEDFDDAGESISVSGSPGIGPYTAIISPPAGTTLGTCRIRVRITYSQTPLSCGIDQYGEVEDYLINVTPEIPNEWTGDVNNDDWHEAGNWLFGHVPYYYEDVVITTDGQYFPSVWGSDAECANLTINTGAELEVYNTNLTVYGNMAVYGQLDMTDASGSITCEGNVDWNNQSTASFTAPADFYVDGHWFFNSGSNAHLDNGIVHLVGNQPAQIKSKSPTSYVNSLYIGKTATVTTSIASDANCSFVINGYLNIQTSDNSFENSTNQDIVVRKNFINNGGFDFSVGNNSSTFIFDGTNQSINMVSANGKFNNIKFSPSSGFTMGGDMEIMGDLTIESGILHAGTYTISLGGNWNNNVGTSAFDEGTGKVVFNGNSIQWCSSEEFNDLELNNPTGAIYVGAGSNVVCASYDWTAGAIDVFNGGTFTANDLIDNGIYGTYILSDASSMINISNYDGYIDLDGEIHINSGTMNIYGGTTPSYWSFDANATIFMSGGVLDFHDQGIYIYNSSTYSLTENITSGIIRTSQGLIDERTDFIPSGGTFEFYGNGDFIIYQDVGCSLCNVNINKSSKEGSKVSNGTPILDQRSGKVLSYGGKSNTITLASDFEITSDLTITSGELKLNAHHLIVYDNCDIYGTLTMDNSADVLSVGQESDNHLYFAPGSLGNISNGEINIYGWITTDAGCSFFPTTDNTVVLVGESGGGFSNYEPGAFYGNIEVAKDFGCTAYINSSSTQPVVINGNFSINNGQFNLNGMELSFYGADMDVNNHGTLFVDDNATLSLDDDIFLIVHTGGEIKVIGSAGNEATVTHASSGSYNFDIYGGTIAAQYAIFDHTNLSGVVVDQGSIVDPTYSFNYCKFRNGTGMSGSNYLTLNGSNNFTATGVDFDNSSGYVSYNVSKEYPTGHVTFVDATGFFAGPAYENDPHNRIDWTGFPPGLWTGVVSTDWFTPENWADYRVPVDIDTAHVTIPAGVPNFPVISGATATCYRLNIETGASLEIGNGLLHTFLLDIHGELIMNNSNGDISTEYVEWFSGASDDVTAGEIHTSIWYFNDGTNAQLGTGNTAYVSFYYSIYDDAASFGNLVFVGTSKDKDEGEGGKGKAYYPVRVSGDFLVESGSGVSTGVSAGFVINGNTEIEDGAVLNLQNGNEMVCDQDLFLDGELGISDPSTSVVVHGAFNFGSTGELDINGGSFVCDGPFFNDWFYINGNLTMSSGLFEITNNCIQFGSTATSNISGGTIRSSSAFSATVADVFKPSGGTVEVIGTSVFPVSAQIECNNGNYFNNLFVDNPPDIWVTEINDNVTVKGNLTLEKNYMYINGSGTTLTVDHNVDLNDGAKLNIFGGTQLLLSGNSVLNINNGGHFQAGVYGGQEAVISHTSGYYQFNVNAGGTISATHTVFEYMGTANGINIKDGAIVDPDYPLDTCTFQNGDNSVPNAALLTIDNNQDITISGVNFPTSGTAYNVAKNTNQGHVTFVDYSGAFSGEDHDKDPYNLIDWAVSSFDLNLTAFLEGPFKTSDMGTNLNPALIPLNQPFNTAPWNYAGSESVTSIPNSNVVDWVLVELRDAANAVGAGSSTRLARQAGFLLKDGSVVETDGSSLLQFNVNVTNNLYAVVWHRNHLGIMSANALTESGGVYTYNFTTAVNKAYLSGQKSLYGKAVMYGGDVNTDGTVSTTDKTIWSGVAGTKGYIPTDMNMDSQVDNKDKNDILIDNLSKQTKVPN